MSRPAPGPLIRCGGGVANRIVTDGLVFGWENLPFPLAYFLEESRKFRLKSRKIIGKDIPDDKPVNFEITVNHLVPHAGDIAPCNPGMLLFEMRRNILGRLPDHLNSPDNRMREIFVRKKILVLPASYNLP